LGRLEGLCWRGRSAARTRWDTRCSNERFALSPWRRYSSPGAWPSGPGRTHKSRRRSQSRT
jgi:hypothetical protein